MPDPAQECKNNFCYFSLKLSKLLIAFKIVSDFLEFLPKKFYNINYRSVGSRSRFIVSW